MSQPTSSDASGSALAWRGELGTLTRAFDWSSTPVGPIEAWPRSLRTIVSIVLNNRFPMFLWWGEELVQFYNDGYRPSLGQVRHPQALGARGRDFWAEIWPVIGPLIEQVRGGASTWAMDQLIPITRDGFLQEVYWTFSYTPVPDDSGAVGGILVTCQETTKQVQDERQLRLLRDLAAAAGEARSEEAFQAKVVGVLGTDREDLPFALLYMAEDDTARLTAAVGFTGDDDPALSATVDLGADDALWPLAEASRSGRPVVVTDLRARAGDLPGGAWVEPPDRAVVTPLRRPGQTGVYGFAIGGVSPRRALDERYVSFFSLVADQIAAGIANVRAHEEERRRAEALAELDRAKTLFFSNVSHEFRTPLTLILGPVGDLLRESETIGGDDRERLEVAHRSASRLLKLVNTLLDFSRIEAGRFEASYERTDLGAATAELAGLFRSSVERAGLKLLVDCPSPEADVYVDREMWEKIVFNLLSNAFKFTLEGEIAVTLRRDGDRVTLSVRDTGCGIPDSERPRVFDRFHRIEGVRGRSVEGSGIGLSMVRELVKLHGGSVRVVSETGVGSEFRVTIPTGADHLPRERIGATRTLSSTGLGAQVFVDDLLAWGAVGADDALPEPDRAVATTEPSGARRARILLADDNVDVREYLTRLLSRGYSVEAVGDGRAALAAARARRPDLVIADVMMPELDGFGLLRELRADEHLRATPVILVSARAGEEARVEGIASGADDYLAKPFSVRELLARVSARLELSELQQRLQRERAALLDLFAQTPVPTAVVAGPDLVFEMANPAYIEVVGGREVMGKTLDEALPEIRGQGFDELLREVMRSGRPHVGNESLVHYDRHGTGVPEDVYFTFIYAPLRGPQDDVPGVVIIASDVTDQVRARKVLQESEARYRHIFDNARVSIWEQDFSAVKVMLDQLARDGVTDLRRYFAERPERVREAVGRVRITDVNETTVRLLGSRDKSELTASLRRVFFRETEAAFVEELVAIAERRPFVELEARMGRIDGEPIDVLVAIAFPPSDPELRSVLVTVVDISDRKRAETALREADQRKDEFLAMLGHELRNPLAAIRSATELFKLSTRDDPKLARIREVLDRQTDHVSRLVDGLLEVSRISSGKIDLKPDTVDLRSIVDRVLGDQRETIDRGGLRLEKKLPGEPVWVFGDDVRLAQVLDNLVSNAVKFTDSGGTITLSVEPAASEVVVRVRDTGVGFGPEWSSRMFQAFEQESHGNASRIGGLGLGLALVKGLVELHGGRVEAHSEGRGEGAEFRVMLPLAAPPAERATQEAERERSRGPGRRLLLVEDNADSAEMLKELLEIHGHHVAVAEDGRTALRHLRDRGAEIVLCDIGLPDMSGLDVARRVRGDDGLRQIPLVALTGYGQREDRERATKAGFDEHLVKPVAPEALEKVLERLGRKTRSDIDER